jgi:tRNA(Ile)-lysidine synthase
MLLAQAVLPGRFAVATVDHGLRAQSASEASLVGALCAQHKIKHHVISLALGSGAGVQTRARSARYSALGAWLKAEGLGALVTAHHADDQAETLLMRLKRGAGVRGLAAMRPQAALLGHSDLTLLRPLLGWRRSELSEIVFAAGIKAVDDPSNRDFRFERARLRADLAMSNWLDIAALVKSAAHLAEADLALDWAATRTFADARREGNVIFWEPGQIPRVLGIRVLERIVETLGRSKPRGSELARWFDALAGGRIATLASVRGNGTDCIWNFVTVRPPSIYHQSVDERV